MNKSSLWAVIVVLLTIIIWMSKCNDNGTVISHIDTVSDTSYIHDTIRLKGKTKIKPIPVPYYVHDTIIDSTGNISLLSIKKYLTNDTFTFNSDSLKVVVYTKIYSSNPLDSISNELKAIIRHKIIETTITKEVARKQAFYAGPSIGIGKTSYISLDGLYERNGKIIYRVGVGFNTRFEPMVKTGVYWQISK
jgi:hypothetical protein